MATRDNAAAAPLGSIENPVKFKDQDFKALQKECLKSGELFDDPVFPAEQRSTGMPEDDNPKKAIKWQRPKEINKDAVFVAGTTTTTDICQGQLGDCWLLAALSCLTMHPKLFVKVVPPGQSLAQPYAGIFRFRFWQYGEWVEVVVDDRLPVREGRLLFSYSATRHEFWSALVEKAYAKLVGSYGSLKGGNISEGMEDFTGGIAHSMSVSSQTPRVLWRSLTAFLARGTLLSCFIQAGSSSEIGKVTDNGLIKGHAYAITDTDKLKGQSEEILLLRLRNPWGFVEYRGPWSDKGKEWDSVDKAEKERIELKKKEDGEFWIRAEDFSSLFGVVELCSVNPDTLVVGHPPASPSPSPSDPALPSAWTISEHEGVWAPGSSAGGSRRFRRSFWKNPQFQLVLTQQDQSDDDDEDEEEEDDGTSTDKSRAKAKQCFVLVELLQKNSRQRDKVNFLYVAFHIYKVPSELQGSCLPRDFFKKDCLVSRSGKYKAQRGVWRKIHLDPGNYVVVASTYRPNQAGEFFIRIFSKTGNTFGTQDFSCSSVYLPVMATPPLPEHQRRMGKTFEEHAGPDGRLDTKELLSFLNSVLDKDFHLPLETCRQLIFAEDTNGRSRLNRQQTFDVMFNLLNLQSIFFRFDEDSSATMSPFELSDALEAVGLQCESRVLGLLSERFAAGELHMPFHGFVSCVTRLRKLFALYEKETGQEVKDAGIDSWLLKFLVI